MQLLKLWKEYNMNWYKKISKINYREKNEVQSIVGSMVSFEWEKSLSRYMFINALKSSARINK